MMRLSTAMFFRVFPEAPAAVRAACTDQSPMATKPRIWVAQLSPLMVVAPMFVVRPGSNWLGFFTLVYKTPMGAHAVTLSKVKESKRVFSFAMKTV